MVFWSGLQLMIISSSINLPLIFSNKWLIYKKTENCEKCLFPVSQVMTSHVLFCPTKSPKLKNISKASKYFILHLRSWNLLTVLFFFFKWLKTINQCSILLPVNCLFFAAPLLVVHIRTKEFQLGLSHIRITKDLSVSGICDSQPGISVPQGLLLLSPGGMWRDCRVAQLT